MMHMARCGFEDMRTGVEHLGIARANYTNPSRPNKENGSIDEQGAGTKHIEDPTQVKGLKIVYPMMITNRLVSQSGAFTISNPELPIEELSGTRFEHDQLDLFELRKWRIPYECKGNILGQLERVSINQQTLFPDLDGLGSGLMRSELLRTKVPDHRQSAT
jgi:hypothetical protein